MIKINLAKKKQASYAAPASSGKTSGISLKALSASADSSALVGILGRILLPLVLSAIAFFAYDHFTQLQLEQMQIETANLDKEKTKIQEELKKMRGFEIQKAELEKTGQILRNKIDTVERLVRGKDGSVKSMIALSQSLPKEVWVTEFNATEAAFSVQGGTIDMGLVSDVMSKLGSSIYFKDVTLKSSSSDSNGRQANFEITARRE